MNTSNGIDPASPPTSDSGNDLRANPRRVSARTIGLLAAAAAAGSLAFAAAASASETHPDPRSTGRLQTSVIEGSTTNARSDSGSVEVGVDDAGSFDGSFECPACGMG